MENIIIYADGSCLGNPGPGGWAARLLTVDAQGRVCAQEEVVGYHPATTNNQMELAALCGALAQLTERCRVEVRLDSQYVLGLLAGNRARANQEWVAHLRDLAARHDLIGVKVPAHAGERHNSQVDRLARAQAEQVAALLAHPTRVVVAGSRSFTDGALLTRKLDQLLVRCRDVVIMSGGARGADTLGEAYAAARGYPVLRMEAAGALFGRDAGHRRNEEMAALATHVVAFWDGQSPGTEGLIRLAQERGLPLRVVRV